MTDDLASNYTIRKWMRSNKRILKFASTGLLVGIIADLLFMLVGATFDGKLTTFGLIYGIYYSFKKTEDEPVDTDSPITRP